MIGNMETALVKIEPCQRLSYKGLTLEIPQTMGDVEVAVLLGELAHQISQQAWRQPEPILVHQVKQLRERQQEPPELLDPSRFDQVQILFDEPDQVDRRKVAPLREIKRTYKSKGRGKPQREKLECGHMFEVPSGHERSATQRRCLECVTEAAATA